MEIWIPVIVAILSALVGPICIFIFKHDIEKKDRKRAQTEAQIKEARKQEIKEVVEEVIEPLKKDVEAIKNQVNGSKEATIANLRATMKSLRDHYKGQGYADIGDKATWKELYNDYKALGGNHFREYVDAWYKDVDDLPDELPKKKKTN